MTAKPKPAVGGDVCQFLCVHASAVITFGMPRKEVDRRLKLLNMQFAKSGEDPIKARFETEESLRDDIERGVHLLLEHQAMTGMFIVWLTMTSDAAAEAPGAPGYVLEFSDSPLHSRNPANMTVTFTSGTRGPMTPGSKPTGRFRHYWTEDSAEAVARHAERFQKRAANR